MNIFDFIQRQCSGETIYTDDLPPIKNEVFISFVLSTVPLGHIELIDPSKALVRF